MSVIERVQKLLRLTRSDNEHEATAAARQACRLILEHDLKVVESLERVAFVPVLTPEQVRQRYPGRPVTEAPKAQKVNPFVPGTTQTVDQMTKAAREIMGEQERRSRVSARAKRKGGS